MTENDSEKEVDVEWLYYHMFGSIAAINRQIQDGTHACHAFMSLTKGIDRPASKEERIILLNYHHIIFTAQEKCYEQMDRVIFRLQKLLGEKDSYTMEELTGD